MIKVGEYEAFTNGNPRTYWDIGAAIRDFEVRCGVKIRQAVEETHSGKALSRIILEGGSIEYNCAWIDFSGFTQVALKKEIADAEAIIAGLQRKGTNASLLEGLQVMVQSLQHQLMAIQSSSEAEQV